MPNGIMSLVQSLCRWQMLVEYPSFLELLSFFFPLLCFLMLCPSLVFGIPSFGLGNTHRLRYTCLQTDLGATFASLTPSTATYFLQHISLFCDSPAYLLVFLQSFFTNLSLFSIFFSSLTFCLVFIRSAEIHSLSI